MNIIQLSLTPVIFGAWNYRLDCINLLFHVNSNSISKISQMHFKSSCMHFKGNLRKIQKPKSKNIVVALV